MSEDKIFEELEEESDVKVEPLTSRIAPSIHDPEWNDYVMTLFHESELIDHDDKPKPLVAGLRRVAEMILGDIVVSGPTQVFPSTESNHPGRATVVFTVQFADGRTYSEVADSWDGNTDDEFVVYNTAVASTRAEARALRKALKLRTVAAEEITSKDTAKVAKESSRANKGSEDGEFKDDAPMSTKQENFINTLCDRAGIDKDKLFDEIFNVKDGKLSKRLASESIDLLNSYNNGSQEIPESIKN